MTEEKEQIEGDLLDDTGVTMLDVLEQEKELEEEALAVLGGSDEKCCTYMQGVVKRQALYSCLTCCPEARENLDNCAGICLACSYRCHEQHELVELYTKRNFRCDCPTKRFAKSVCVLNGRLDEPYAVNTENKYNQNFQALYCICKRPYPDPDRTTEEVMLQCAICEDWYHLAHLGLNYDASKLADNCCEMVCANCMKYLDFLNDYRLLALKLPSNVHDNEVKKNKSETEKSEVNVVIVDNEQDEPAAKQTKFDTDVDNTDECTRPKLDNNEVGKFEKCSILIQSKHKE